MTVSSPNTHVRYHGSREGCERLRPWGFHLAGELARDINLNFSNSGNDNEIGVRSREFGNGEKIRVLIDHEFTWIDIYSPDGGGAYEVVEETKIVYDLYMDPILYFDSSTELRLDGDDEKCRNADEFSENECYSQRLFERVEIARSKDDGTMVFTPRDFTSYSDAGVLTYDTKLFSKNLALNKVCYPFNRTKSHGVHHCYNSWSKTVDQYTAHAILYYNSTVGMNMWCIAVDVAGVAYEFRAAPTAPAYSWWPDTGYLDVVWCSNTDPYNTTATYKCFDLWKEDVTEDDGTDSPHYFVSCIGDPDNYIQVFDLSTDEYSYITLSTAYDFAVTQWPTDPSGWQSRHIRHIGLVKRTLYWAYQDHYYGVPVGASGTIHWENDEAYGTTDLGGSDCGIQFAILNEYDQTIEWMDDIACQVCDWEDTTPDGPDNWGGVSHDVRNGVSVSCKEVSPEYGSLWCDKTGSCGGVNYPYTIWADTQVSPWCMVTHPDWYDFCCEHTANWTYWSWDCLSSRYVCEQTGLSAGGQELNSRSRTCWGFSSGCDSADDESYCVGVNGGAGSGCTDPTPLIPGCGVCTVNTWDNWMTDDNVLSAHVLPAGLGVKYDVTATTGERGSECATADDYEDIASATTEYENTLYDADYAQSVWPYYPQYAIMVSGEACNKPILTEKKKYTKPGDKFIDGIRIKPTEDYMEENCRLSITGDNYSIVLDNNGTLHDNLGNTFNRAFEATEVGLFFMEQRRVKTRRINEYVD